MWKLYFKNKDFIETLPNGIKHLASYNAEEPCKYKEI